MKNSGKGSNYCVGDHSNHGAAILCLESQGTHREHLDYWLNRCYGHRVVL